jgi:KDO2-lipid IV(A) lauroyltransferase
MLSFIAYSLAKLSIEVIPRPICIWVGRRIADVYFMFDHSGRRAVIANLTHVCSATGRDTVSREGRREVRRLARETFENFAVHIIDFLRIHRVRADIETGLLKFSHFERFRNALSFGRGLISVTAHIGNWEMGAAATSCMGIPLHAVALRMKNKRVDGFFSRLRMSGGIQPVALGHAAWDCFRALKRREMVAFVADRDVDGSGCRIRFFGKEVSIPRGPAEMAAQSGAPVVPAFCIQETEGRFRLVVEEVIDLGHDMPLEQKVDIINQRVVGLIEKYISRYPSQWFAFYRVWNEA